MDRGNGLRHGPSRCSEPCQPRPKPILRLGVRPRRRQVCADEVRHRRYPAFLSERYSVPGTVLKEQASVESRKLKEKTFDLRLSTIDPDEGFAQLAQRVRGSSC